MNKKLGKVANRNSKVEARLEQYAAAGGTEEQMGKLFKKAALRTAAIKGEAFQFPSTGPSVRLDQAGLITTREDALQSAPTVLAPNTEMGRTMGERQGANIQLPQVHSTFKLETGIDEDDSSDDDSDNPDPGQGSKRTPRISLSNRKYPNFAINDSSIRIPDAHRRGSIAWLAKRGLNSIWITRAKFMRRLENRNPPYKFQSSQYLSAWMKAVERVEGILISSGLHDEEKLRREFTQLVSSVGRFLFHLGLSLRLLHRLITF
jgi:hypothetical protein